MANTLQLPGASRRALLRQSGGLLAASAVLAVGNCGPTVAPAATPNPDAELLSLCRQFLEIQAELEPLLVKFFATPVEARDELDRLASLEGALWDRQDELADRVLVLRAHTQEGMAAKAGVARGLVLRQHRPDVEDGSLPEEMAMVWSLFQDMCGRA